MEKQLVRVPADTAGLKFLYETVPGRVLLKLLSARGVSKFAGHLMDSRLSRPIIPGFIRKNHIDLSDYLEEEYPSFNAFFCRRVRPEARPVAGGDCVICPCDGLMSVYPITDDTVLPVKQSAYTLEALLKDASLARKFAGGTCFVFRLCVNHYHRYCYPVSGEKGGNRFLPGVLHTVRPIALRNRPVFAENCREYTVTDTERYGRVLQMEVGAMLVGKILNNDGVGYVKKGAEKGCFLYGGSTIILLFQKDAVRFPEWYLESGSDAVEIPVKCGEWLAGPVK